MEYPLKGNMLNFRSVKRSDFEHYQNWLSNEKVTQYLEIAWRPVTDKDFEEIYNEANNCDNSVVFIICDKKTNNPIGICGLHLIHWPSRRAQLRIIIGDCSKHNLGFGYEATKFLVNYGFKKLNLNSIYLGVNADNLSALNCYKKVGFLEDGRQRKFIFANGVFSDCICMSILKDEFYFKKS